MAGNQIIRLLFSILLIPIGIILIMFEYDGSAGKLLPSIGLAFIVAGIVSSFKEIVLRRLDGNEAADKVANSVHDMLKSTPLSATGIRLVSPVRKGYDGYYHWVMNNGPQEMFFAGRCVLHRIDADFRVRTIGTAESMIARRLNEGASIKIMFLDPRSEVISRLATEEGQTPEQLFSDIAISIGICKRLHKLLNEKSLPHTASLDIHVFDEIPYFAYHRVDHHVIVGFYFSSAVGHASAAFEVVDPQTKEFFGEHFLSIFGRSSNRCILRIHPHRGGPDINLQLIEKLKEPIKSAIGDRKMDQLMSVGGVD